MADTTTQERPVSTSDDLFPGTPITAPAQTAQISNVVPPQGVDLFPGNPIGGGATQPTETIPAPGTGKPEDPYMGFVDNLEHHLSVGAQDMGRDFHSFAKFGFTDQKFEDFDKEDSLRQFYQKQLTREDLANDHIKPAMSNALIPFGTNVSRVVAESVPGLGAIGGGMALGAGAALALGAPVTVPVLIGGATVAGILGAGKMMYDLRQHGMDAQVARIGGIAAGAANAALMFVGGGTVGRTAETVFARVAVPKIIGQLLTSMGINTSAMVGNNLADATIKYIATLQAGGRGYKPGEIRDELGKAVATSLLAGPAFAVGGAVLGAGLRVAAKPFLTTSEQIVALTAELNKLNREAEIRNAVELQEKYFGKPEITKEVKGELYKPKSESAAKLQGKLEVTQAQTTLERQESLTARIEQDVTVSRAEIARLEKELDTKLAHIKELQDTNPTPVEIIKGKATAVDNTVKLNSEIEKTQNEAKEINKNLDQEKKLYQSLTEKVESAQGERARARIAASAKKQKVTLVATEEQKNLESLSAYTDEYNQRIIEERSQEAAKRADETAKKLKDELYIKNQVSHAVNATRVLKGAHKLIPEGKEWLLNLTPEQCKERLEMAQRKWWQKFGTGPARGSYNFPQLDRLLIAFQDTPEPLELAAAFDTSDAVEKENTLHREYNKKLNDHIIGQVSTPWLLNNKGGQTLNVEIMAANAAKTMLDVTSRGADGKSLNLHISVDQALEILQKMKNKKAWAAMGDSEFGNNFTKGIAKDSTESVLKAAIEKVDPNHLQANVGMERYWEEMGPILKTAAKNLQGKEIGVEENYGGPLYRKGYIEKESREISPEMPTEETELAGKGIDEKQPRYLDSRGFSKLKLEFTGAYKQASDRARRQAIWEAMVNPSKLWSALVQNSDFKYSMDAKYGSQLFESLDKNYRDTVNGFTENNQWWAKYLRRVAAAKSASTFMFKLPQMPKHVTTISQFALYSYKGKFIPPADLLASVGDVVTHLEKAKSILEWDEVQNRYEHVGQIGVAIQPNSAHPIEARIQKGSMGMFTWGDMPALIGGANAVERFIMRETNDPILARQEAVHAYQQILASSNISQLSDLSVETATKTTIGMFQQPKMQIAKMVARYDRYAANFPTLENIKNAYYARAVSNFSAFLFDLPDFVINTGIGALEGGAAGETIIAASAFRLASSFILGNRFPINGAIYTIGLTLLANAVFNEKFHVWAPAGAYQESVEKTMQTAKETLDFTTGSRQLTLGHVLTTMLHAVQGLPMIGVAAPEQPIKAAQQGAQVLHVQ